jgi:hypothetical protein
MPAQSLPGSPRCERQGSGVECLSNSGSPLGKGIKIPTRRIRSPCCARTVSGHAAAVAPSGTRTHSIASSAVASSLSGTVRPSILAVEALMTSSNLVDCATGRSAGLAPLRMRPV